MGILCSTGKSQFGTSRGGRNPPALSVRFGPARAARPDRQEGAVLDLGKSA